MFRYAHHLVAVWWYLAISFPSVALGSSSIPAGHVGDPSLILGEVSVTAELGQYLSPNASIIFPGSADFSYATFRWQGYGGPDITLVVEVATEGDIQQTILYANRHGIPFLAVGGGHGATSSLGKVHNGIQIWTRGMNSVEVAEDGQTAIIGPGAISKDVVDALWAAKKMTTTGACDCTGFAGPLLGGGHGWLQGRHGLMADNLIEAKMVLANGTAVTVSNTSHPDLFWAIRGAGHNFGVVTQFKQRIYDVEPDPTFAYEVFIFSGDKVEQVYAQLNRMQNEGTPPVELSSYSWMLRLPQYDPVNPVIRVFILHEGSSTEEKPYGAPYHAIGPLSATSGTTDLLGISALTYSAIGEGNCLTGNSNVLFPISLIKYNVTAQRAVYDVFSSFTAQPEFSSSTVIFEGYSIKAVKDVPHASTAVPARDDNVLIAPIVIYKTDTALDGQAIRASSQLRDILREGSGSSELHTYVNYAHGDEMLQETYGYEPWRVERLRALKKEYDPLGRFNFYAPII